MTEDARDQSGLAVLPLSEGDRYFHDGKILVYSLDDRLVGIGMGGEEVKVLGSFSGKSTKAA